MESLKFPKELSGMESIKFPKEWFVWSTSILLRINKDLYNNPWDKCTKICIFAFCWMLCVIIVCFVYYVSVIYDWIKVCLFVYLFFKGEGGELHFTKKEKAMKTLIIVYVFKSGKIQNAIRTFSQIHLGWTNKLIIKYIYTIFIVVTLHWKFWLHEQFVQMCQ